MNSRICAIACVALAVSLLAPVHATTPPCPNIVHRGTDPTGANEVVIPFGDFTNSDNKKESIPIIGEVFTPGAGKLVSYTFTKVRIPTGITFESQLIEWNNKVGIVGKYLFNSSIRHTPMESAVAVSFTFPPIITKAGQSYFASLNLKSVPKGATDFGYVYADDKDTSNGIYFEYMDETYYIPKGEVLFSYAVCPATTGK